MPAWPDVAGAGGPALSEICAVLERRLADVPPAARRVACSGGLDSSALLTALVRVHAQAGLAPPRALHVNHGLHPDAGRWAASAEAYCASLGVTCSMLSVAVVRSAAGLEADARHARYAAFLAALEDGDRLLLAHHRDDQAETVMLRLLRGAGPAGLAAMPERRRLGRGELRRPLLDLDRALLERAATEAGVSVAEDPSNALLDQDRNFLRHAVLPLIARRWPGYRQTMTRAAVLCGEQERALDALLGSASWDRSPSATDSDMPTSGDGVGTDRAQQSGHRMGQKAGRATENRPRRELPSSVSPGASFEGRYGAGAEVVPPAVAPLPLSALEGSAEVAALRLRRWLAAAGTRPPARARIQELLRQKDARPDAGVVVELDDCVIRRFAGALHRVALDRPVPSAGPVAWQPPQALVLPHGMLQAREVAGGGLRQSAEPLAVAFRRGGERLRPVGRSGRKGLKKLCQEAEVPPWERDRLPLLYVGDTLVAVADLWIADGWQATDDAPGWKLTWIPDA